MGCILFCDQLRTLFTQLEFDGLDPWWTFLLAFWAKYPGKPIIMQTAVDFLLAQDHRETNNHRSTVQSLVPFLTRCLAGPPESKVNLGRSEAWCALKTPNRWAVCAQISLFNWDLEAHQSSDHAWWAGFKPHSGETNIWETHIDPSLIQFPLLSWRNVNMAYF